ncbi:hypothetical protein D3C71_1264010 [compost metagenome]
MIIIGIDHIAAFPQHFIGTDAVPRLVPVLNRHSAQPVEQIKTDQDKQTAPQHKVGSVTEPIASLHFLPVPNHSPFPLTSIVGRRPAASLFPYTRFSMTCIYWNGIRHFSPVPCFESGMVYDSGEPWYNK